MGGLKCYVCGNAIRYRPVIVFDGRMLCARHVEEVNGFITSLKGWQKTVGK